MIDEIIAENNKPKYDFNYLCRALNLLPYHDGAFSPAAVIAMDIDATGAEIELRNSKTISLTPDQLAELEKTIRAEVERQTEENKAKQQEAIKSQMLMQIDASMTDEVKAKRKEQMRDDTRMQMKVMAELQGDVQPGMIVGAAPTGRRFRQ